MFEDKINMIIDRVTEQYDPKAIIVFGSVAKGDSFLILQPSWNPIYRSMNAM